MNEPRQEPMWLRQQVNDRVANVRFAMALGGWAGYEIVMTTLTDPDEDTDEAVERHERTCDKCGAHCPHPVPFFTGVSTRIIHVRGRDVQVIVTYGFCQRCSQLT